MKQSANGFWNRLKAEWYHKGLRYSKLPEAALSVILPNARGVKTLLDVGAGCGALSIPLAAAGMRVTALEPSEHMLAVLERDIKEQSIENITPVAGSFADTELKPHDGLLCANVPELTRDPAFLKAADALARSAVFIIAGADPNADKFYYRDLYPLLFNKPYGERQDYLSTYTTLHSLGIFANVVLIEYDFDQPFDDLDEAVEFWKEYMGIVTMEHDERLRGYLEKRLDRLGKGLIARFHKKAAVIWWKKEGNKTRKPRR